MIRVIHSGVKKNLFTPSDANVIEQTLQLINSRLDDRGGEAYRPYSWGFVYG